MKYLRYLSGILFTILLLAGCDSAVPVGAPVGSNIWKTVELNYGTMEAGKLQSLPWDSGRLEATSFYRMAETEKGYYFVNDLSMLYYADKENPELWIPVCNKPDCDHITDLACGAKILSTVFLIKDGRIWFEQDSGSHGLYAGNKLGTILASMKPDGTERRAEYVLEEALQGSAGGAEDTLLSAQNWLYCTYSLQPDGSGKTRLFLTTQEGTQELPVTVSDERAVGVFGMNMILLYGDPYTEIQALDGEAFLSQGYGYCWDGEQLQKLDMSEVFADPNYAGGYISGSIFRSFRLNDGYYDLDLKTGQEVRLGDARLENSCVYMVLPNCVIETTLHALDVPAALPAMEIFDGEEWHTVSLPQELATGETDRNLTLYGVTSDGILFGRTEQVTEVVDEEIFMYTDTVLYLVSIQAEQWEMKRFATVHQPRMPGNA